MWSNDVLYNLGTTMKSNNLIKIEKSILHNNAVFTAYGFKHAIVSLISASVLHPRTTFIIDNVPLIDDVKVLCQVLQRLGASISLNGHQLVINTKNMQHYTIDRSLCADVHGVIYLLPSLLARFDHASLYECGGCQIGQPSNAGKRPVAHMLSVLSKFGFDCQHLNDQISGTRVVTYKVCDLDIMNYSEETTILTGPQISGATKTAILAAMGPNAIPTRIKNRKPDVTELIRLMRLLNYDIKFDEKELFIHRTNKVDEVSEIHFSLINDVSEVMTYICVAVFNNIEAEIQNLNIELLKQGLMEEFNILKQMGVNLEFDNSSIKIPKIKKLKPVNINVTSVGIYSDHQPFFAILMSLANGESNIIEHVWKSRFAYAAELNKLGFNISIQEDRIKIHPMAALKGQPLVAKDLRAAAVLLIAALKAEGTTLLEGAHHLSRGYENFEESLLRNGARLTHII
jgi:UDP-N-acetylglucosamine 1-carboxyvinyltransferase